MLTYCELDSLVDHPNRDAILDILEETNIEEYNDTLKDDRWTKDYMEIIYKTEKEPTEKMGSTLETLADNMIFNVKDLACWNFLIEGDFKYMTLDPEAYKKHCDKQTKNKKYHDIREIIFYSKTWKYRPIKTNAAKIEESISSDSINSIFANFNR